MRKSRLAVVVLACTLGIGLSGCGAPDAGAPADVIFFGDNIVTMDPNQPTVAAVAVRGEAIVAAGSVDDVMALEGAATRVVDLGDRALLPGFIDAHGHFLSASRSLESLQLHPPPVGDVNNIDDLVGKIQAWIVDNEIPPGQTVSGRGYDDSLLEEGPPSDALRSGSSLDGPPDHPDPRVGTPSGVELGGARRRQRHRRYTGSSGRLHSSCRRLDGAKWRHGGDGGRAPGGRRTW